MADPADAAFVGAAVPESPADYDQEEQLLRGPEAPKERWLPRRVAVVAALLLGSAAVGCAAMGARRSLRLADTKSWIEEHAMQPYQDPQGRTVCNAFGGDSCQCDCSWAHTQPGACLGKPAADDCCWTCCCAGQEDDVNYDMVSGHGDAYHGGYHPLPPPPPPFPHPPHPHPPIECRYHEGDRVYVRGHDGHWHMAVVVVVHIDCRYRVRFEQHHIHVYHHHYDHHGYYPHNDPEEKSWWWLAVVILFSLAISLCIYLARYPAK